MVNAASRISLIGRATLVSLICLVSSYAADAGARTLEEEQQCLALSIYWEARGEGRIGMFAVGWVVLNRIYDSQFPSTPCDVVREGGERPPCQFSWWCDGRGDRPRERDSWIRAMLVAADLLTTPPPDPTGGALFYHSTDIRAPWGRNRARTARIGAHVFYR